MRRTAATFALATVTALALTGCVDFNADLTVNSDDTMSGVMVVTMEKNEYTQEVSTEDGDQLWGQTGTMWEDETHTGMRWDFENTPIANFVDHPSDGFPLSLTHQDGTYVLEGTFDGNAEMDGAGDLAIPVEATFQFTFPGEVTESNGVIDGDTVTWTGDESAPLGMNAVALDGSTGPPTWAYIIVITVVLAIVGLLAAAFVHLQRRRRLTDAAAELAAYRKSTGAEIDWLGGASMTDQDKENLTVPSTHTPQDQDSKETPMSTPDL